VLALYDSFEFEAFEFEGPTTSKETITMSRLAKAFRSHREFGRSRREIDRAISNAASPAMRDELINVAQRNGGLYGR
jgi:hypothetical protein